MSLGLSLSLDSREGQQRRDAKFREYATIVDRIFGRFERDALAGRFGSHRRDGEAKAGEIALQTSRIGIGEQPCGEAVGAVCGHRHVVLLAVARPLPGEAAAGRRGAPGPRGTANLVTRGPA